MEATLDSAWLKAWLNFGHSLRRWDVSVFPRLLEPWGSAPRCSLLCCLWRQQRRKHLVSISTTPAFNNKNRYTWICHYQKTWCNNMSNSRIINISFEQAFELRQTVHYALKPSTNFSKRYKPQKHSPWLHGVKFKFISRRIYKYLGIQ